MTKRRPIQPWFMRSLVLVLAMGFTGCGACFGGPEIDCGPIEPISIFPDGGTDGGTDGGSDGGSDGSVDGGDDAGDGDGGPADAAVDASTDGAP